MRMSDADLRHYIRDMLRELAELADTRADDAELGAMAFKLRLLAGRRSAEAPLSHRARQLH